MKGILASFIFALTIFASHAFLLRNPSVLLKLNHPQGRIVNGKSGRPGQFPYQVMLHGTTRHGKILCGGSLLSDQWVITAAHCTSDVTSYEVHLGAQSFMNISEPGRVILITDQAIVHERYNSFLAANDIALVRLSQKVNFTEHIQPVSLPTSQDLYVGKSVIATGWGIQTTHSNLPADQLQYADLEVISNTECYQTYDPIFIKDSILCARGKDMQSVCSGDSGGALVLNNTRTLVGISSFVSNLGCDNGLPGGFQRVSSYVDWISTKTGIRV